MAERQLTCEDVERDELDLAYLRGRLSPERAEAFEAHYFGCDRCWALVRGGGALRAARPAAGRRGPRFWMLLAAALIVGAVGVTLWRVQRNGPAAIPGRERGGDAAPLVPVARSDSTTLLLSWPRIADAAGYRVRLFGTDGALLAEREVAETSFALPRREVTSAGPWLWQVLALDRLGEELRRSGLIDAVSR